MPAIKSHSTETTKADWDAAEAVRRLREDQDPQYYARVFAWRDPDGNPRAKTSYKFPHHEVSAGGEPGAANLRACAAAIAVLNGARGGADIPDADREAVYQHLARHYRDASEEPPELAELAAAHGEVVRLAGQFELAAAGGKAEERTARIVWYSGTPIQRADYAGPYELHFSMDPQAVRLERLNNGAPLLRAHQDDDLNAVIGVIERAWLEHGRGIAIARFSRRPDVDPIWQDVKDGVIRNASMGVVIHRREELPSKDGMRRYLVTDWEPLEVSLVAVPADPKAGLFKGSLGGAKTMSDQTVVQQQQTDAQAIRQIVLSAKLPESFADGLIAAGVGIEQARAAVLNKLADDYEARPTRSQVTFSRDYGETLRLGMEEALYARLTRREPAEIGRQWHGVPLWRMCEELLRERGERVATMRPESIVKLTLTTSDLPNLLTGVGQRVLLDMYQYAAPALKRICRVSDAADFREQARLRLGEMPPLLPVAEGAPVTYGPVSEAKAGIQLRTFGRMIGLSREAVVNDDLQAFSDALRAFGVQAAALEGQLIADLINSNANAPDGVPLFHANHGNLAASGAVISVASVGAGRAAMRSQKGVDGVTILDVAPRWLVVPVALQTAAESLVTAIWATKQADANPFAGRLEVIADPRLDAGSTTAWYLAADPQMVPTLEIAFLSGQAGPQVETKEGWERPGLEIRCIHDVGAAIIDFRGVYKNPGA